MKPTKDAVAGSLESSDALVTITPTDSEGVDIRVDSIVMKQYGRRIHAVAEELAATAELSGAILRVQDRGALECTLRARIETAIGRATA